MIWLALLLAVAGLIFTVVAVRRKARGALLAGIGTALAILAYLSAASIGFLVLLVAAAVLAIAAARFDYRNRIT
jgi:hypothetical protein